MSARPATRPPAADLARRVAGLALLGAAALAGAARAEPLPATLALREGRVAAAIELGPALPGDLVERLGNGLRNVVAVAVGLLPAEGEAAPVGARIVEVLFDVWEARWEVTVRDARSPSGRREPVADAAALRALLGRAADADLGPGAALPAGRFELEVRVDLNPVSPELLARTREHLAGSARPGGGARSVLGAVAGFLLREPDESAGTFRFTTVPLDAAGVRP